ncbi:MAG: hypothetical protein IPK97_17705 [Ahniella sp.]|nr:hypothetical protein [Ahniella sp.]
MDLLERGEADLIITIESYVRGDFPQTHLFDDDHSLICWRESAHRNGVSMDAFCAAGHAMTYFGPTRAAAFSEVYFETHGIERRADVLVPSFAMLPGAVIGTDRLATMQSRFAEYFARTLPIEVLPLPFEFPKVREVAQWHSKRGQDAGLQWLVQVVREHAARL